MPSPYPWPSKDVPELEPFDDSAFDAAFDRLRSRKARAGGQSHEQPAHLPHIPFVGGLIKRLPRRQSEDTESTEE